MIVLLVEYGIQTLVWGIMLGFIAVKGGLVRAPRRLRRGVVRRTTEHGH